MLNSLKLTDFDICMVLSVNKVGSNEGQRSPRNYNEIK